MLIAIIQRGETGHKEPSASIKAAVEKGADTIILRGFDGRYLEIKELFDEIRRYIYSFSVKLLINAMPDEDWEDLKPDGFHLNRHSVKSLLEKSELLDRVKKIGGVFGASVHNLEEMRMALLLHNKISIAYILISPIFKPSYNQMAVELGIDGFKRLYDQLCNGCKIGNRPRAVALGGVNHRTADQLLSYNFIEGVGAMSAFTDLSDEAVRRWGNSGML